jgi:hypothetical protein
VVCHSQESSVTTLVHGTGEPIEKENLVQFRLLYSGSLLGAGKSDTRASLKHEIRLEFHPQLKRLWATNQSLLDLAQFRARSLEEAHPGAAQKELRPNLSPGEAERWTEGELAMLGLRWVAEKWERCGRGYIPLVTEEMCIRCSLDILFLRPEEPGLIIQGGDIDNRMKTLFDALRMPSNLAEAGGEKGKEGDEPIYCLLQDDRLISEIRIVTDHLLLLPHSKEFHSNDVFLVIDVKLNPTPQSKYQFWMA